MRIGIRKSERFQMSLAESLRMEEQEVCEDIEELESLMDWGEEEELDSPFAFRANPSPEEVREFLESAWFYEPVSQAEINNTKGLPN